MVKHFIFYPAPTQVVPGVPTSASSGLPSAPSSPPKLQQQVRALARGFGSLSLDQLRGMTFASLSINEGLSSCIGSSLSGVDELIGRPEARLNEVI